MSKFIQISPEGDLFLDGNRLDDQEFCLSFLKSLRIENNVCKGYHKGEPIFVEAKSQPLVVQSVEKSVDGALTLHFNYKFKEDFYLNQDENPLFMDDWSRICGLSKQAVPFVFSRKAQASFLTEIVEPEDAETFIFNDKSFELKDWYIEQSETDQENFWSGRYQDSHTPWDLKTHHPSIDWVIPRLKLSKSRILVPGCGRGHDVKKLSDLGHQVTGLDFSQDAISEAKSLYPNSNFVRGDLFKFEPESEFDAIFEHTLFCALSPSKRGQIVKSWLRLLGDEACLIGVFNVSVKQHGPPFGMTEWELEELLSPYFIINFWGRLRGKESPRPGKELFVHAQKKKGI
jgi:hypothetical protein